nr:cytochrome P450 89A2-like [Ipomoea trifida]
MQPFQIPEAWRNGSEFADALGDHHLVLSLNAPAKALGRALSIGKAMFHNRWKELKELARDHEITLAPFIKTRYEAKE